MAGESANPAATAPALPRILLVSLTLAITLLLAFGWLADEVAHGSTMALDLTVRAWLHSYASPGLTSFFRAITQFGSPAIQWAGSAIVVIGLWWRGVRARAVLYLVAMGGAGLLLTTLKHAFHRTRPDTYFGIVEPHSYSFPSGHALLSFCMWGVLAAFLAETETRLAVKAAIWGIASILILLIGISRIYLSVHYFTDVVAGYCAAFVWTTAVAYGNHLIQQRRRALGA